MSSVHVIVPCYNYARYLTGCVESVLSQPGVDVGVLVIDDCSTDETPAVCRALSARDSRVEVIRHSNNKGHIATYNEGLERARSDYVVLLSADDLLTPGALSRATALLDAHPSVGLVYGHPVSFEGEVPPRALTEDTGWTLWSGSTWIEMMARSSRNFIVCPEAVVRTSIHHKVGGYRPHLPHSGDMELWLRIAAVSDVGRINGADQAYYRVHPGSMQRTINAGVLLDLEGRRDAFRSVFKAAYGRPADAERLHAIAARTLARIALRRARQMIDGEGASPADVDAYCRFALALDPTVAQGRNWRIIERSAQRPPDIVALLRARYRTLQDDLATRRWQRTGVY